MVTKKKAPPAKARKPARSGARPVAKRVAKRAAKAEASAPLPEPALAERIADVAAHNTLAVNPLIGIRASDFGVARRARCSARRCASRAARPGTSACWPAS